ncbi:MAG TPA: methyltransferase domain-containing protein [Candidatus Dormibacteraeota bacterium]|jgi:SAM-dependent methyltransferase
MLTELLHRAAANPFVYDTIQVLAGAAPLDRRLAANLGELAARPTILDVGGGTGMPPSLWPAGTTYLCLDIDPLKLAGFRHKRRPGIALRGDATQLPIRARSVDLVVCKNVGHHLSDSQLVALFRESARVLKPAGRMLFIDPVLAPERWRSRLLWRYDRGSHPRTVVALREAMASEFDLAHWEDFAIHFRYVLGVGTPRPATVSSEPSP